MPRPQTKRLAERVYRYLEKQNEPKTTFEIIWWYMDEYAVGTTAPSGKSVRGSGMGSSVPTPAALGMVMRRSVMFDCVGKRLKNGRVIAYTPEIKNGHTLWVTRPLEEAAQRAIKSRRPIKKYPAMLQREMRRILDAEGN